MSNINPDTTNIHSREDLSAFLLELARNIESGDFPLENGSSIDYVRAAGYWVRSMHKFFANRGEEMPDQPNWQTIAMIFSAACVYE